MTDWRDAILNEFVPRVSKLTLVADPDALLTEERLALALRERGFDLIEFNDSIEFRYAYESNYRSLWDLGESTGLVVVLRLPNTALDALPYDLLRAGRKLAFSLSELFPHLSYPVVEQLDRSLLDALYQACQPAERLGDNATRDFILRHGFGIVAELIASDVDLLRALLRLHYAKTRMPRILADRLVQVLGGGRKVFKNWPLAEIVPDEAAFFAFLQERWPVFLAGFGAGEGEQSPAEALRYPGPERLPFYHHDIRVYIDNLFVEGKLAPVRRPSGVVAAESWLQSGLVNAENDSGVRADRLFKRIENQLPTAEFRHTDWIAFALKWAELSALVHRGAETADKNHRLRHLGETLNATFAQWLLAHYAGLINLPPTKPAMVHHLPRHLARELEEGRNRGVALLVIDGLALDQWVTLRPILQEQDRRLILRESATFAWIPTLTSVSRQAIFSGKPPLYFPTSIHSTHNEGKLWTRFWESTGLSRPDIAYQRGLGDGDPVRALDAVLHPGKTRVVGLVVDKVDKIMHGMQLGAAGMHNQIEQWGRGGFLGALISHLLDHGYSLWLTADHGNIECRGKGRPAEGVIAETRGERVRVYPTPELRARVASQFPFAFEWSPVGLPPDYFPLLAGGSAAFINPDEIIVGHGGIAIEEVIVPLVKLERRTC